MPYSNYTLKKVKEDFNLEIIENKNLFLETTAVDISEHLQTSLAYNVPLAMAIGTEKIRSELIVSNVLLELKQHLNDAMSLFSGIKFDVDKDKDLNGFCDYILSSSPEQFYLSSPIVTIVEAKNEQVASGLGQCIAEMIALEIFNEREKTPVDTIYGVVTTGNIWKFLKYRNGNVCIDAIEYHISDINKILGILVKMVRQE